MILQIIVIVLLMFSAGATIPVTTTEITSPTDRFNSLVLSITLHPDNPRLLIVTDKYAVHTFNPETKTKKLIAGSTTPGYVEGRGAVARFDDIYGVSYFNETTIIVTDDDNYCVRLVSLISQLTERYAGVCQSDGYSDGERLSAKFFSPNGMTRVGTSFYVCDFSDGKIRQLRGNSVSTVVSGINLPTAITSTQNKLFYSFQYGIGEFDLNSQTNKILTGGASRRSGDGSLSSAGFSWMFGITSLTEKILLAADWSNNAVRLIDLNKQTVSSITMPTSPYSLLPYNGNILVGLYGDGRIVKFSLTQLPVDVLMLNCPVNMKLVLPDDSLTLNTTLPRPDITGTRLQCLNCPPHTQLLSEGVHEVNFIFQDKLTKQNVNCSYQVDVIKPAPICDIGVAEVHCPTDLKLILPHNVNQLNISLSQPQIDDTRLSCVECPDSVQLDTGDHNITFSYMDKRYNVTIGCGYLVTVIEQPAPTCHNETKRLFLRPNQSRTDKIADTGVVIRFDVGKHEVEIRDGCYITYVVNAPVDLKCPEDVSVYLPTNTKTINMTLPTPEVDDTRLSCVECPDSVQLDTGDHNITFSYMDNIYNVTIGCSYLITVIEQPAPTCHNETKHLFLRPNQSRTDKIADTGVVIKFDVGKHEVEIRDGCYITYVVNAPVDLKCPEDVSVYLPTNTKVINMTLPTPEVDDTRLSCVECPDSVQLDIGDHNITFSYMDNIYNVTIGCSYLITVIEQTAPTCHNETKRLFLRPNQKKTDEIKIGGSEFGIRFDEGEHEVKIRDGCYITYVVNEISTMNRQVRLEAEYPIKCQSLSKISLTVINSFLVQHTQNIRKLCSVCQIDGSPSPLIECTNDTLIASWNTAITGNHQVMSDDTRNKLHSSLVEFQSKYSVMDITIFTTVPRTVSPIKDSNGLNLRVVIKTTCADKEFQYNKQYDVCERVRQ